MKIDQLLERFGSLENKLIDLEVQLESKNTELYEMARVGAMITSFLELEGILSAMIEMSLRLLHAEVGCIILWDEKTDEPRTRISWGIDYSMVKLMKLEGDIDIAQWARDTGESVIINDFPPETEIPAMVNSVIAAPLRCRDETIGVLVAVNKTDEDGFNNEDKNMLETLTNFAGVAIENSKLMDERLKRQKLEDELALANVVQQALLPDDVSGFDGASVSHIYYPAGQVGGDYYDVVPLDDKHFVIVVGDVSNKGVPAALMMTAVRSVVRHEVRNSTDIAAIMTNINRTLCRDVMRTDGMFISLVLAYIDLEQMEMTACNAGHLPPLFYNPQNGDIEQLKQGGIILGTFEDCEYKSETVKLKSGDMLLCFTDGVTESMDRHDNMFGRDGLIEYTRKHMEMEEDSFLKGLKARIDKFVEGAGDTQFDDITCVLVRIS